MDVEQVQKINNLALELMKQGLAPDREAAIAQAEQIYSQGDTQGYNEMRETLQEVQAEKKPEIKEDTSELTQNEIKTILKKNTDYIVGKLKEFQVKISSMEKIIAELRQRTNRIQDMPSVKDLMAKGVEQADEMEITPKGASVKDTPKKQEPHPRVGNYVADDVSIEKFFYMGNK
jgi:hypothetical protein